MLAGRRSRNLAAIVLVGSLVPLAISKDLDPITQKTEQEKIKKRIDEAARRAGSTLDAMRYQRLSSSTQQTILEEVAKGLRGLSDKEVKEVLARLDAAISAPDEATATKEQREAYAKQREIVSKLRGLTGKLDVLHNLDEAAAQLDAASEKQLTINFETMSSDKAPPQRGRNGRPIIIDTREELGSEQADLRVEVASIFERIAGLIPYLTPEQKERADRADAINRGKKLIAELDQTVRDLRNGSSLTDAGERQRGHAKELQKLAAALRTPPADRITALKAAQEKVIKALAAQTKVNEDTKDKAAKDENPIAKAKTSNDLANQQTKAEFAASEARLAARERRPGSRAEDRTRREQTIRSREQAPQGGPR